MKNIILLSDGTGNSAAKRHKTNVWRLYEALDLHDRDQIAMYDDGVGSQGSKWSKILGGAFGFGLKRNVIELYKFLCRNVGKLNPNEYKLYFFGFSRGAFTVRVLVGFIKHAGLKTNFESEKALHDWTVDCYRQYRNKYKHGYLSRFWFLLFANKDGLHGNVDPEIAFVGVWDTVDAYVFPIDELAIIWDLLIYPIRFPDHDLWPKVRRACHALSIDDERHTFHPVMWNDKDESGRIDQVWFAGVHSDVGGGYPRKSLSLISLDWMLSKVEGADTNSGLVFIDEIRKQYFRQSDWNGPQHNSRSGLAVYYRYKPRDIKMICGGPKIGPTKIHRSVFERIREQSTPYAPTNIPKNYELVGNNGNQLPMETPSQRQSRSDALNYALDVIFWRRWLYFLLLGLTLLLIVSRFLLEWDKNGVCQGSACFIDPVMQFLSDSLPDFLSGWFAALGQNPFYLWGFIILYYLLFKLRRYAWMATQFHATCAWSQLKKNEPPPEWKKRTFTYCLRQATQSHLKQIAPWIVTIPLFVVILYLLFAVMNGTIYHMRNTVGALCKNSETMQTIDDPRTFTFDIGDACYATGIKLEQGITYRFNVPDTDLYDGENNHSGPDGYSNWKLFPFVALRRHIAEPWFKLCGKINDGGNETFAVGQGVSEYTARADGELFLYVNDAVFGVLPEWDLPYRWALGHNTGLVKIAISRVARVKNADKK